MTALGTIRDVLGRERPIARIYPDGSFDCPFCFAAALAPAERCVNPWCPASQAAIENPSCAPRFREQVEAAERQEAEAAQRRADSAQALERIEEERARCAEARAAVVAEAEERGACIRCATADAYRPRFVRHRKACPRAR